LISGMVALKTPEAWFSMTGTVAQSTPDYSCGRAVRLKYLFEVHKRTVGSESVVAAFTADINRRKTIQGLIGYLVTGRYDVKEAAHVFISCVGHEPDFFTYPIRTLAGYGFLG
ncbi:MAG: hypothetical protein JXA46_05535, partial [Dehalococcoidales bacterium]|nr:hypothetical protein [Dehalococcoidales bacterium]